MHEFLQLLKINLVCACTCTHVYVHAHVQVHVQYSYCHELHVHCICGMIWHALAVMQEHQKKLDQLNELHRERKVRTCIQYNTHTYACVEMHVHICLGNYTYTIQPPLMNTYMYIHIRSTNQNLLSFVSKKRWIGWNLMQHCVHVSICTVPYVHINSLQEYDKKSEELDTLREQKKEYELRLEGLQAALTKSRQVSPFCAVLS